MYMSVCAHICDHMCCSQQQIHVSCECTCSMHTCTLIEMCPLYKCSTIYIYNVCVLTCRYFAVLLCTHWYVISVSLYLSSDPFCSLPPSHPPLSFLYLTAIQAYSGGGKLVSEFIGGSPSPLNFLLAGRFVTKVRGRREGGMWNAHAVACIDLLGLA